MKSFASDNYASIHPRILKSIADSNVAHAVAYGSDPYTLELSAVVKDLFGKHAEVFPVFNGTGANVLSLMSLLKPFEAVLCSSDSHIHMDECGAVEKLLGSKLIDIPSPQGKLNPKLLEPFTLNYGNEHQVQARVLSLTQSTERASLYSLAELQELKTFCSAHKIRVHMDGARFANAVAALGVSPREVVEAAGVEVLSLGGTKNGLMLGELVVTFSELSAEYMKYYRKQLMQLSSKMRFISAQFCEYFKEELWLQNARRANAMAKLLEEELSQIKEIEITQKARVNAVFAKVPRSIIEPLQKDFPFYVWDEQLCEVRWMCAFDTSPEDVMGFTKRIRELFR